MIRRPPRSTQSRSSAASDVYKRQNQQSIDDGECEWKTERDAGANTGIAGDLDAASQTLHALADDIHSDSTAGDIGNRFGGGEAGAEDEREDLGFGKLRVGADDPLFN